MTVDLNDREEKNQNQSHNTCIEGNIPIFTAIQTKSNQSFLYVYFLSRCL